MNKTLEQEIDCLNIKNKGLNLEYEYVIDVKNKEFVGIIGPNGSGKSTFLKCIYRILKPSSGIIKLDEVNLSKLSIKESSKKQFLEIIEKLRDQGAQAVILGCTEIGLLVEQKDVDIPVYDTALIHAEVAAEKSLK